MAAVDTKIYPSLSEQYLLKEKEDKLNVPIEPAGDLKTPVSAVSEEVAPKEDEAPTAEKSYMASEVAAAVSNVSISAVEVASEESNQGADETSEIKLETAPADFRFPTTNQTRHCFTRYVEYHRCIAAKGDSAPECDKFAKYYRSLCPGEWIERWNEQRENGCFPGPL